MRRLIAAAAAAGIVIAAPASARIVDVTVSFRNLAPPNSISFAPLHFGFHAGLFDAFDNGAVATAPIISVAEGGTGSDWFPAFAAAEPQAVLGTVGPAPILPGALRTGPTLRVNTAVNPFFTFASMVVPSNDIFIGNDNPQRFRVFDADGNLLITEIPQSAAEIWNAGSEALDPLNAAFVQGGNNDLRTPEGGVVEFSFRELLGFNGLTTAANYVFDAQLTPGLPIARITFAATPVPEPGTLGLLAAGLVGLGLSARRHPRAA